MLCEKVHDIYTGVVNDIVVDVVTEAQNDTHSQQTVELSQWIQTVVQIVLKPPSPSNGSPIYRVLGKRVMWTRQMAGAAPHKGG